MLKNKLSVACSDSEGRLYNVSDLTPVAKTGDVIVSLNEEDLIPLPKGSSLMMLPRRMAIGLDEQGRLCRGRLLPDTVGPLYATSALLPMGYARTFLPAFKAGDKARQLPLFGYTSVCFINDRLYTAAVRVEPDNKEWDPQNYNKPDLKNRVTKHCKRYPSNRLLGHLGQCAIKYGCFTAQNIFYRRWEGGIPVSPICNASCLGCISKQISECCPSPQERIDFTPTVEEVVEIAAPHLDEAAGAIISFGQGCEGEPTLMGDLLLEAVKKIRSKTKRGLININTNGSRPKLVGSLARLGLNNIRVSLISPLPALFETYVRPRAYSLDTVKETIRVAAAEGLDVSLNYLIFPGVSDREEEIEAMIKFLRDCPVHLVQLRNLNIDPDVYLASVPRRRGRLLGIRGLCRCLEAEFPDLLLGSYTHA